jgi:Tol biopolymer transport system component
MKTVVRIIAVIILLLGFYACDNEIDDGAFLLTPENMEVYSPEWSLNTRIIFNAKYLDKGYATYDLWFCNENGGELTRVTTDNASDELEPSCSPDGLKAVCKVEGSANGLYLCNIVDGNMTPLVLTDFCYHPTWSPDGLRIAYDCGIDNGVYIVDAQGGTPELVATGAEVVGWTAGGKELICERIKGNRTVLVTIELSTRTESEIYVGNAYMGDPAMSSDGEWVAYRAYSGDQIEDIYIANVKTGDVQRITAELALNESNRGLGMLLGGFVPTWSPDGTAIAFVSTRGQPAGYRLYKVKVR